VAEEGIAGIKDKVDALIVIPNQRILEVIDKKVTLLDAFRMADSVLEAGGEIEGEMGDSPWGSYAGMSVLGASKEFFGSNHFLIQVGGKSSLARVGLMIHNTAGIINPGHFLNIVFEITNQSNVPIILRPGMEIAQITFSMLSSAPSNTYQKTGRYAKNNWNHFVPAIREVTNQKSRVRGKKK
jgi:hypothetical protein